MKKIPRNTRARLVIERLHKHYPKASMILRYSNNWELLVAVMLSAQCTDVMVNKVTPRLFKRYKTIQEYANADIEELETIIKPTGFYHMKAKRIQEAARMVLTSYQGIIPISMNDMLRIPGVARKTANAVLGNAYGVYEGVAVDTHVKRLSNRLGLSKNSSPEKIEKDLMKLFDQKKWFLLTYVLIEHGRRICTAKKPLCGKCFLSDICPSAFHFPHFKQGR